jgi:uncharacterized protein
VDHVAVFARWPEPGRVKTRLSPALPPELACDLHRAMLEDALSVALAAPASRRSVYWEGAPSPGAGRVPPGFEQRTQVGADLGERLAHAFAELLDDPACHAVVIGADCPDLEARVVEQALEALRRSDVVIGPAIDGGYYLIGLAHPAPELFAGIAWSTPRVLAQTLERTAAAGRSVEQLQPLEDLDTPDALVRWLAVRASTPVARGAPATNGAKGLATARALRAMKLLPEPR